MAKKEFFDIRSTNKRQMEKIIRRIKWMFNYDAKSQDSLYVQQRIYFAKKTLEFLDKFSQEEFVKPSTIFKMLSRIQQLTQGSQDKFYSQLQEFLMSLLKINFQEGEFREEEFNFFNKKID